MVEGACATSLLAAGGKSALVAIQTASIVAAFPYTLILNILCVSIYVALVKETRNAEEGEIYEDPAFSIGLMDFVTTWQVIKHHCLTISWNFILKFSPIEHLSDYLRI